MKYLYITNDIDTAIICDQLSVDEIFIDLELRGKSARQSGLNTFISTHQIDDISKIKKVLKTSEILVRIDAMGSWSHDQINKVISMDPDTLMLPYFKSKSEVEDFIDIVDGRVKTCLLVETYSAIDILDSILEIDGVNRIHIGLNDLSIEKKSKTMFEPYSNDILDNIAKLAISMDVDFGIGGIGYIGSGLVPSPESIIAEQIRLGSSAVILSRSFANYTKYKSPKEFKKDFSIRLNDLRNLERSLKKSPNSFFKVNKDKLISEIKRIT
jgi:hypothetical protein